VVVALVVEWIMDPAMVGSEVEPSIDVLKTLIRSEAEALPNPAKRSVSRAGTRIRSRVGRAR
jgi:hypothetical protein